jgi:hypothetical protein
MFEHFDASNASPYGRMEAQSAMACAYTQLNDSRLAAALDYLRTHKDDNPGALQAAELCANHLDQVAALLIASLNDPVERGRALLSVQDFADPPFSGAHSAVLASRWRSGSDVQAALRNVGRVLSFPHLTTQWN